MSDDFELEFNALINDSLGDPINEFTKFPVMKDITYRPEDIEERALYGVSQSDIWNAFTNIYWLYAEFLRSNGSPEANILLQCLIDLNEYSANDTVPFYVDNEKFKAALEAHLREYGDKYEEALIIWPKLYPEVVSPTGSVKLEDYKVEQIIDTLIRDGRYWVWDEVKDVLPDPTTVPSEHRSIHEEQRGERGYSDWDAKVFPDYIHWVIMNSALWLGSEKAHGFPARYEGRSHEWGQALKAFIEGLIYGTYVLEMSEQQQTAYQVAIGNMLDYFPDFWD